MSPSLKYLIVSSIAARNASSDPMSLTATLGVEWACVLLVMCGLAPDADRESDGYAGNRAGDQDSQDLPQPAREPATARPAGRLPDHVMWDHAITAERTRTRRAVQLMRVNLKGQLRPATIRPQSEVSWGGVAAIARHEGPWVGPGEQAEPLRPRDTTASYRSGARSEAGVPGHRGLGCPQGRSDPGPPQCAASAQLRPVPTDTSRGTRSEAAPAIAAQTRSRAASNSPGATSMMSSSWTCSSIRERSPAAASALPVASIATLITSAAEPWIGALSAIRSAISRRCRLSEVRSGRYRRRPIMVAV